MNTEIENLSKEYINALKPCVIEYRNKIFQSISQNTKQFCLIEHYYIVSKTLFYILTEIDKSHKKYKDVILLTYYCLFKYILNIRDHNKKEECCSEFAEASALAFILISENIEFIKNEILQFYLPDNTDSIIDHTIKHLCVCYWNYYFSPINIHMENELHTRLNDAVKKNAKILKNQNTNIPKEFEESVYKNIATIITSIERIFSNNEK